MTAWLGLSAVTYLCPEDTDIGHQFDNLAVNKTQNC